MKKIQFITAIGLLAVAPKLLFAVGSAGFENASFSAEAGGQGNAVVAQADEAAAISYNPAGIVNLPGIQVQSSEHLISTFTYVESPRDSHMKSAGTISPVPTAYLTINPGDILEQRVAFGIGSDSPFGLSNKWDSNYTHVHYTGWRNWLEMYTIKPILALKITDWLQMGAGPVYYRIMDFGAIHAYPNILIPLGATGDGQIRANLSGNTWGWQYGALLKPHKQHSLGIYFRSPVTVNTRGRIRVENSSSGNFETGANAKVDLPLNLTVGYAFLPTDRTTIEADFGFTRWAAHKRLFINADHVNPIPGDLVPTREDTILAALGLADKDYGNSFSLHLGGNHKISEKLTLRGGSWYYSQAVPQDHFIPAVPDSNRIGFAAGIGYGITKNLVLDLCYFNAFNLRRKIAASTSEALGQSVDGNYFSYLQDFSITLTYKWEDLFHKKSDSQDSNRISLSGSPAS